ncbi:MAG: NTP transferase domain-containing protein [Planctomycetota bacterium]|nr:NTP transferase domain-containing protein [Planctomycetota bacterium]MCX8039680.1 NTP transferase domain-containing protein [Planctomycetota bacterium]MDW8373384.1 NTP transferase domain-containing protein [Planctomycetota bacterium]
MSHTTAVILAAGKGTRMGSELAKVLHPLAGRPLVAHVLAACREAGIEDCVCVIGWQREAVRAVVEPLGARCVVQDRQLGTGHAVQCAEGAVRGEEVLVLCGDAPLVDAALIRRVLERHRADANACTVVAARLPDPTGYGRMITDGHGRLLAIVEHRDATPEQRAIDLVNSGLYCFRRAALFTRLTALRPDNAQGEYYLTDVVAALVRDGERVGLLVADDAASVLGVNTPADLALAERLHRQRHSPNIHIQHTPASPPAL